MNGLNSYIKSVAEDSQNSYSQTKTLVLLHLFPSLTRKAARLEYKKRRGAGHSLVVEYLSNLHKVLGSKAALEIEKWLTNL